MNAARKQGNVSRDLVTKIKIAQKQIGISDDDYRALLWNRFGVESSTALSIKQKADLLNLFILEYGWKPRPSERQKAAPRQKRANRRDFVEIPDSTMYAAQKRYALVLARALGWSLTGLNKRIKQQFGVDHLIFVNIQADMQTLIKDMCQRCRKRGIDPKKVGV